MIYPSCIILKQYFIGVIYHHLIKNQPLRRGNGINFPVETDKIPIFFAVSIAFLPFCVYTMQKMKTEEFYDMANDTLSGGNETILIVDDHETIWDFLIDALQELGYSVLLAENGLDAVEIYESNPGQIDLVLLDMIMPKSGGHQTFMRLKAIDPEVKVLLSSGFVSEQEVADLLDAGACGFLPKPHRLPVVAGEIRRILDQHKNG
ncbi:MAG: response regulator [Lentisphaerae bacterium]|nr:response regulator [Lentisphaerota bacterium]